MSTAHTLTADFVSSSAPNDAAVKNAQKISAKGGFLTHCISQDETLIFGECAGSGKTPYSASVDFSEGGAVFRCSCPSRQFPCKHCLALMLDWLAGKQFVEAAIPADILAKREKREKKAENAAAKAAAPAKKKSNSAAAAKKLKVQREGLDLAEQFVRDILTRGICAVTPAASAQYLSLAKQLGDYYLPEPQAIMLEITHAASSLSEKPDESETARITALCVRLASSVKKCRAYIDSKLESGDVLPEDSVLYEAMGGIWKLTQLDELGLSRENAVLIQLAFAVTDDAAHKAEIDTGYWIDTDSGTLYRTENIRPYKAAKHIKAEVAVSDAQIIPKLYLYPGEMNRRVRWEQSEPVPVMPQDCAHICQLAEGSIAAAVKKAKNELKNSLSRPDAVVLLPFDAILFTAEKDGILRHGSETIALAAHPDYPRAPEVLRYLAGSLSGGAVCGALRYLPDTHRFVFCPFSVVTQTEIIRL